MRRCAKTFDMGLVLSMVAVAGLYAFEVDVFETAPVLTAQGRTIQLDELLALTTLVTAGALFYTWRRAKAHQRESELRSAAELEARTLAFRDPLTGLPNRRQFDDALRVALKSVPTAPEAHAVIMIDLNNFKTINDIHGHPAGDQTLIHVGSRLLRAVRDGDLVARLGGDEFAILACNVAGAEGAATIASRIVDGLSTPIVSGDLRHTVGAGIGVALSPQDGDSADELVRRADVALYRAKTARRSQISFFEVKMDARLRERAEIESALRQAIADEEVGLRFTPTALVSGAEIAGFEATPYWSHATLGELGPERIYPIAEETDLLTALTAMALTSACRAAAAWPHAVRLSFMLPSALLHDTAFGLRIAAALAETQLNPLRFDLEIDEGALIRNGDAADLFLAPLRRLGVSVVVTHFGTGYASIKNLNKLQVDRVKIDRSYVAAMTSDRQAAVIVKALIGLGQGLDLEITADGVGTPEQMTYLAQQGCQQVQGSLCGAPMSEEDATALLAGRLDDRRSDSARGHARL